MNLFVVNFTNAERETLLLLAARDEVSIEEWVRRAALIMAGRSAELRVRSPSRRTENSMRRRSARETTPPLVKCRYCHLDTRPVKTCDNCARPL